MQTDACHCLAVALTNYLLQTIICTHTVLSVWLIYEIQSTGTCSLSSAHKLFRHLAVSLQDRSSVMASTHRCARQIARDNDGITFINKMVATVSIPVSRSPGRVLTK